MLKNIQLIKPVMIACSAGLLFTACATDRETSYSSTSEGYSSGTSEDINESSGSEWQQGSRSQQSSSTQYSGGQSYSQGSQQVSGNEVVIPLHEERLNVGKRTVDAGTVTIRKVVTTETVNQPIELRRETLVIDREGAGAQRGNEQFQSSTTTRQSRSSDIDSQSQADESDAGVSAQAQVGQSEAGISAGADQSGAGVSASADFDEDEPAGAATSSTSTTQRSSSTSQSYSSGAQPSGNAFQEQTYTIQLREEQPVVEKSVVQTGQVVARKNSQMQRQTVQREVRREDVRVDQGANARNVEMRGNFDSARSFSEPSGAQSREIRGETRSYQSETEVTTEPSGTYRAEDADTYEDKNTLDDINRGSNTRGGAEDLQRFDERSQPRE